MREGRGGRGGRGKGGRRGRRGKKGEREEGGEGGRREKGGGRKRSWIARYMDVIHTIFMYSCYPYTMCMYMYIDFSIHMGHRAPAQLSSYQLTYTDVAYMIQEEVSLDARDSVDVVAIVNGSVAKLCLNIS